MINSKNLDRIYILQQIKQHSQDQLRDKGIELYISNFDEYDMKNIEQVVKDDNFEKLSDLISGNGIEVDLGEEEKEEELIEENQEEIAEEKIIDSSKKKNFIEIKVHDKEGNELELVFEVTFDENGVMETKYAGEVKGDEFIPSEGFEQEIRDKLKKAGIIRSIEPQVIEREFFPKTIEELNEMNDEGKLDLEDDKEIAKRAIEAQKRKNDGIEQDEEKIINKENEEEEIDEEEVSEELSEEEKSVVEKACEITGRNPGKIKRVLTIQDPKSATDTLDNDGLDERGAPITVLEFKSSTGKDEYVLVQEDRVLDRRFFDEDINKLVRPIVKTQGNVEKVSDEQTKVKIKTIDGKEEEVKVQSMPSDLNQSQKEEMIAEVEKIMAKLEEVSNTDLDYFETPEAKYEIIDKLEIQLNTTFEKYGVIPPSSVKTQALDETEAHELNEQKEVDEWIRTRGPYRDQRIDNSEEE